MWRKYHQLCVKLKEIADPLLQGLDAYMSFRVESEDEMRKAKCRHD